MAPTAGRRRRPRTGIRGVGAPLTASDPAERGPLSRALLEAGLGGGALLTRDPSGRRVSVLDASIEPARAAGLEVRGGVVVDRVLLKARTGRRGAPGGRYGDRSRPGGGGGRRHPLARCATAQRRGTRRHRGRGLQDHPSFPIGVELHEPWSAGRDTLALSSLLKGTCRDADDLQVLVVDVADPSRPSISLVMAAVMRVDSVGEVRLASSDPHTHPGGRHGDALGRTGHGAAAGRGGVGRTVPRHAGGGGGGGRAALRQLRRRPAARAW